MDILTECRCNDLVCFLIISQLYTSKITEHLFFCKVGSKKFVDLLRLKFYSGWLSCLVADINHTTYNLAGTKLFHQLACTVDGSLCVVRVKAFLKFTGCICTKADSLGRKTDAGSIKACSLKKNGFYIVCDHGVLAAHDTSDADRFFAVTDHQNVLIHGTLLAIQCDELLIFSCTAHNDLSVCDGIQIIRMHWLTKLFHYIVCDINQVVDRTDSIGSQTSLHPLRRRTDLNIFYNSRTVTRAEFRILYSNFYVIGSFLIISLNFYNRRAEFFLEGCCCLSCDSKNAVAVYTVGSDLVLKYHIVKTKCLNRALTNYCILRENIDAVLRCLRVHLSCTSKLLNRAHHTTGLNSTEFTFFDLDSTRSHFSIMTACNTSTVKNNRNFVSLFYIWSTCYDLYALRSDVYLADDQLICIRMFLDLVDLADHDLVKICIQLCKAFYLCAC